MRRMHSVQPGFFPFLVQISMVRKGAKRDNNENHKCNRYACMATTLERLHARMIVINVRMYEGISGHVQDCQ